MRKFLRAKLGPFLDRFEKEKLKVTLKAGPVSMGVPVSKSKKNYIAPTRKGHCSKNEEPFVESDIEKLIKFYSAYKNSKEYKYSGSPYADTIPLKNADRGFSYGKDVSGYTVDIINAKFILADILKKHGAAAINCFKLLKKIRKKADGEWENNLSMRIAQWGRDSDEIKVQPAYYFDQVSTNLTLDWASTAISDNTKTTIRNDIEPSVDGFLPKLKDSILSNTLGIAVFFVSKDHKDILIPIRGNKQAIMSEGKGQFHCSASGVFEWPTDYLDRSQTTFEIFVKGMEKEIKDELNLSEDQYILTPLAFSRELVRGGKPQLFFIAESKIDISKIEQLMRSAKEKWEFIFEDELPYKSELKVYLKNPAEAPKNLFTYEGWMGLKILYAYLENVEPPFSIL